MGSPPFGRPYSGDPVVVSPPPPTKMFPFGGFPSGTSSPSAEGGTGFPDAAGSSPAAGGPIRRSRVQRPRAPTPGLSQLATAFLGARAEPSAGRRRCRRPSGTRGGALARFRLVLPHPPTSEWVGLRRKGPWAPTYGAHRPSLACYYSGARALHTEPCMVPCCIDAEFFGGAVQADPFSGRGFSPYMVLPVLDALRPKPPPLLFRRGLEGAFPIQGNT